MNPSEFKSKYTPSLVVFLLIPFPFKSITTGSTGILAFSALFSESVKSSINVSSFVAPHAES